MNKEEIEKLLKINETIITSEQCKEHRTLKNDERVLLMNNIKIKDYIQELEFQNTALKAEHNHNITRIKDLEQKETILDKVTEYIENYIDDKQNEYEAISESYICQTDEDEYIKEKELAIVQGQKQVLKNVLNIMEGEKK